MKVIYKYEINPNKEIVDLPVGAKVLVANSQDSGLFLWAEVDVEINDPILEERCFRVFPTGEAFDNEKLVFLNTIFVNGFVFHVYEEV